MKAKMKVYCIDAETDPFEHEVVPKAFIWGCISGGQYWEFETTSAMCEFIKKNKGIYYAHNGGKFDFHLDNFSDYINADSELMIVHNRLIRARIGESEIRDSYALLPLPLSKIGSKLEMDYSKMNKDNRAQHMPEIKKYLRQDCAALYQAVKKFHSEYGNYLTIATSAINNLATIEDIELPKSNTSFFAEFNRFYHGGRVECIEQNIVDEKVTFIDINSSYPRAMIDNHAWGFDYDMDFTNNPSMQEQNFYHITCASAGALPYKLNNKLYFPNDNLIREYFVTGWELLAGIDTHTVKDIKFIKTFIFKEKINFKKFIEHHYVLRSGNDKIKSTFHKLIMNSGYGKLGANPEKYESKIITEPWHQAVYIDNGYSQDCVIGTRIVMSKELEKNKQRYYNVATAASITGNARARLWRVIHKLEDDFIYCDTDSIAFTGHVPRDLDGGTKLGQWKIEGVFNECYFIAKKLYAVTDGKIKKIAAKGVVMNFADIKKVALGGVFDYLRKAPSFSWKNETSFLNRKITK